MYKSILQEEKSAKTNTHLNAPDPIILFSIHFYTTKALKQFFGPAIKHSAFENNNLYSVHSVV